MAGRVIRSDQDWADTIIIDANFGDLFRHSGHLFPKWFTDSINKINIKTTA
jgi:Rad3-related DNA helicase